MAKRAAGKLVLKQRAYIATLLLFFLLGLLLFRLYDLQVVKHEYYAIQANKQYNYKSEFYDRGKIYFRRKDGSLLDAAGIKTGYILAIAPNKLKNPDRLYNFLTKDLNLKINYGKFLSQARKKDDPYEEIKRRLPKELADKIRAQKIKGVILVAHRYRFYPEGNLAPQAVGFVAKSADDSLLRGRYGLERFYDDELYRDNASLGVNFFAELFGGVRKVLAGEMDNGDLSIVTSIEPLVQKKMQEIAEKTAHKWHSKRVSIIVYNPNNGEVISMASYPGFNLNDYAKVKDVHTFENPLVENVYEMGSIVKALTVASGLDYGVISEHSTYNDTGHKTYNGSTIYNYDKRARGVVPVQEILSQSLNVGAAWVYERLGKKRFKEAFKKLGLLDITGIDLPNEADPIVHNLNSPRDIEYATASFGQGVAFTPIAMVRALGALGTGKIAEPHLAVEKIYNNGLREKVEYDPPEKVFSDKTKETISRMLTTVVDKVLAHGKKKKEHYSVAIKTGTAQISSKRGGYIKNLYNHTFFGYFPSFSPRFVVLLVNEEPHGAKYASQTLTEPFYEAVDFLINYYNIEPDR